MTTKEKAERPVIVTTEYKGVFFGFASDTDGDAIRLRQARNVMYWPSDVRGFMGLAAIGPLPGTKSGPPADIELRKITSVVECSESAAKLWEKQA